MCYYQRLVYDVRDLRMQFGFHVRDVFIIHSAKRFCPETPRNVTKYVMDTPYILGLTRTYGMCTSLNICHRLVGTYLCVSRRL